jgi:SAM-dependent methyltransferase
MTEPVHDVAHSYDAVPYDAGAVAGAHPDALAVVGRLWGMQPPDVAHCRVLELGCSTGENLAALAIALPDAEFTGIDASPAQIATGRARLEQLGVVNVRLECRRIEDLADAGTFDYVLCHGVYSWVPAAVRRQILALAAQVLAPQGLAYISFNTHPGWHMRQQLRNLLLFHLQGQDDVRYRIAQSHALLEFLAATLKERTDAYGALLREEVEALRTQPVTYLFHEFLEDVNEPEYFSAFVAHAAEHGLRYVDEVRPHQEPAGSSGARDALLAGGADRIALEQYLDFIGGRGFRRSVLCRQGVRLDPPAPEVALPHLRVASAVVPERQDAELTSATSEAFRFRSGPRVETNHPAMKVALAILGTSYPRAVPFQELCGAVDERLADVGPPPDTGVRLAQWLYECHRSRLVELHAYQPPIDLAPGQRPTASPLARLEAQQRSPVVTSLRHVSVALHPYDRELLGLLDGSLSRDQLVERMAGTEPPPGTGAATHEVETDLALQRLAYSALLLETEQT